MSVRTALYTCHALLLCVPLSAGSHQLDAPNSRTKTDTMCLILDLFHIRGETVDTLNGLVTLDFNHFSEQRFGAL